MGQFIVNLQAIVVISTILISATPVPGAGLAGYVGSESCRECHEAIYKQWKITPHARMLVDAKKHPEAILADDFTDIPFEREDILFTVGSHWFQEYLGEVNGRLYLFPKSWNLRVQDWHEKNIWDWEKIPYGISCIGCHTVGFSTETGEWAEVGIGCEACHGPGKEHVGKKGKMGTIVNPSSLSKQRQDMICESCHTEGKNLGTREYFFPVGFKPGEHIDRYYTKFFMPKPGSDRWYRGTMDYAERHRSYLYYQVNFYRNSYDSPVHCLPSVGGVISAKTERLSYHQKYEVRIASRSRYCGTCHKNVYNSYETHARHTEQQAACDDCHVPTVIGSGERYSIHDHKFDFSQPPITCEECHGKDMSGQGPPAEHPGSHDFNIREVKIKENLTLEEACRRCHPESVWQRGKAISLVK